LGDVVEWMPPAGYAREIMTRQELLKRIVVDPRVCFGRPVIRGTRIWVSLIVENLAEGVGEDELLKAYPQLAPEDLRAALAYAAEVTRERVLPLEVEVHE
jgi:uncharacterized protein (DUF433 family)